MVYERQGYAVEGPSSIYGKKGKEDIIEGCSFTGDSKIAGNLTKKIY